ncbi:MAG TPA: NUDIX hydrolase [Ohtaekwangia sp.]|nr:NUDIX hydrolase [Ohtaekwangia sp.]
MNSEIAQLYGNKVRFRVCGMCWDKDNLLMVNHKGLTKGSFWAMPGGGMEFGESLAETLKREFLEETGLRVEVGRFLFGCEMIQQPLHAIELFFEITNYDGNLQSGKDPELQIIDGVKFLTPLEINTIGAGQLHGILKIAKTANDFRKLSGFYRI